MNCGRYDLFPIDNGSVEKLYANLKHETFHRSSAALAADALKGGSTKIGVSLTTGVGKTVVWAVSLLKWLQVFPGNSQAIRTLFIVNSAGLARQAADQARKLSGFPYWTVGIEQGARYTASGLADACAAFGFV